MKKVGSDLIDPINDPINDPIDDPIEKPSYEDLVTKVTLLERTLEEKTLVEGELREKIKLSRLLIDNVPDMVWAKDIDDRYIFANRVFCDQLLKCSTPEEAEGKKDTFFADRERAKGYEHTFGEFCDNSDAIVKKSKKHERFLESGLVRGKELILEVSKRPVTNDQDELIGTVGCGRDVTHITNTVKVLENASQIIRKLTDEIDSVAIQGYDEERRVTLWNTASEKLYGYTKSEAIGKALEELIIPDAMKSDLIHLHRRWLDYGEKIPSGEHSLVNKEGESVYVFSTYILQYSSYGKEMFCIDVDLSPLKLVEKERIRLQEQLQQSQKMEAIGTLAGGIAHDFNNLLTVIIGNAELTADRAPLHSPMRDGLGQIIQAGLRAKGLVGQILDFSRQKQVDAVPLVPGLIVNEVLQLIRATLPPQIVIEEAIDMESGYLLADPTQFHQLCMNLCTNAFQAMEKAGGTLSVRIKKTDFTEDDLAHTADVVPGPFIQLTVQDTGPGMHSVVKEKIFDPYFTTKKIGEGTGMGLAIVHGIVKSYGGFITCISQLGKGSVFNINLPALEQYSEAKDNTVADISLNGCERILFVDDEEMLGRMAKKILERLGYEVVVLNSPVEALQLFEKQPELFDMLITDLSMPEMDGIELAREILALRSDLPIILCTGNSSILCEDSLKDVGIKKLVNKPFNKNDFAIFVREVLDLRD